MTCVNKTLVPIQLANLLAEEPLAHRIGKKKAIVALSHSVLVIIYHLLRDHRDHHDLGASFFETLDKDRIRNRAVRHLEPLGYSITLHAPPAEIEVCA